MSTRGMRIRQVPKSGRMIRQPFGISGRGHTVTFWGRPSRGKGLAFPEDFLRLPSSSITGGSLGTLILVGAGRLLGCNQFPGCTTQLSNIASGGSGRLTVSLAECLSFGIDAHRLSNGSSGYSGRMATSLVESLPDGSWGRDFFCTITPVIF